MRIEHPHALGRQEAIARLDHLLDALVKDPPGGAEIGNVVTEWDDNRMRFSFTASKGGFGTTIRGTLEVTDDRVVVDADLPVLVKAALGEARVQQAVSSGLKDVLGQ
jgi:Putative polyhydroxyalkanoic acid system protein (PHA_gran_rgn)